jgi:hypothetical protein
MSPRRWLGTAARLGEALWQHARRGGRTPAPSQPDETVTLLATSGRSPASAAERFAVRSLAHGGPMPLGDLVDRIARELYYDELRQGASAADIGLPGIALFRADARRAVDAAQGVLWTCGPVSPGSGRPAE